MKLSDILEPYEIGAIYLSIASIATFIPQMILFLLMGPVIYVSESAIAAIILYLPGYILYRIIAKKIAPYVYDDGSESNPRIIREEWSGSVPFWMRLPITHLHIGIYYLFIKLPILLVFRTIEYRKNKWWDGEDHSKFARHFGFDRKFIDF